METKPKTKRNGIIHMHRLGSAPRKPSFRAGLPVPITRNPSNERRLRCSRFAFSLKKKPVGCARNPNISRFLSRTGSSAKSAATDKSQHRVSLSLKLFMRYLKVCLQMNTSLDSLMVKGVLAFGAVIAQASTCYSYQWSIQMARSLGFFVKDLAEHGLAREAVVLDGNQYIAGKLRQPQQNMP